MNATRMLRSEHIINIPTRWNEQYPQGKRDKEKEDIYIRLKIYIDTSTLKDENHIDSIIGNSSWTSFTCDVCGSEVDELYYFKPRFYDEYENSGMCICLECLEN